MTPPASAGGHYDVPSGRTVGGRLRVPASKSVTQRYFNLALLGRLPLTVHRPLLSEDTRHFLAGLAACGFLIDRRESEVRIVPGDLPAGGDIFCGAGGTMFRFLTAALTAVPGRWRLDGIPRLRQRTVAPLLSALRQLGAEVHCPGREGFAPLEIAGGSLRGGHAILDAGASSQFLSAILMAAQVAPEPTRLEVTALTSEPYVDLTLDAIAELGGTVRRVETPEGSAFRVEPSTLSRRDVEVEADFSAAAYPAAAAALTGGAVELWPLRAASRQGDRRFLDLLERMGARVAWTGDGVEVGLPPGGTLRAVEADLSALPDQVPTLAALAPFARGTTRITDVPHLRIKESDRLQAMARELARAGAEVEELADGLVIPGIWAASDPPATPVEIHTWGDHRIAMSMALVGLRRPGVRIAEPGVVAKSYPGFWDDLDRLLR